MKKFEVGKRYRDGSFIIEVVGRSEKMISFVRIYHPTRGNEKRGEKKKAKIREWCFGTTEAIISESETYRADEKA